MKPGEWNWTQAVDISDGVVDRMSRGVWVVVPITDDPDVMDAVEDGRIHDLLKAVDPTVLADSSPQAGSR